MPALPLDFENLVTKLGSRPSRYVFPIKMTRTRGVARRPPVQRAEQPRDPPPATSARGGDRNLGNGAQATAADANLLPALEAFETNRLGVRSIAVPKQGAAKTQERLRQA